MINYVVGFGIVAAALIWYAASRRSAVADGARSKVDAKHKQRLLRAKAAEGAEPVPFGKPKAREFGRR